MLREFTDKSGVGWLVWDVYPTAERAPGAGWLCFESVSEKQRVAPVPSEWETWDPLRLEDVLDRARRGQDSATALRASERL